MIENIYCVNDSDDDDDDEYGRTSRPLYTNAIAVRNISDDAHNAMADTTAANNDPLDDAITGGIVECCFLFATY